MWSSLLLREGTTTVAQPDVWYFDNHESQYTFTTITSFDAASGNQKDAQTYLLGSGNILYVSPDAMYVSYQKYHPVIYPMRGGMGMPRPSRLQLAGVWVQADLPGFQPQLTLPYHHLRSCINKNCRNPSGLQHPDGCPAAGDPRWSPERRAGRDPTPGSRPDHNSNPQDRHTGR